MNFFLNLIKKLVSVRDQACTQMGLTPRGLTERKKLGPTSDSKLLSLSHFKRTLGVLKLPGGATYIFCGLSGDNISHLSLIREKNVQWEIVQPLRKLRNARHEIGESCGTFTKYTRFIHIFLCISCTSTQLLKKYIDQKQQASHLDE